MDILRLLEELNRLAVEEPRSFGPIVWGLNRDEISMQIVKIRASVPQEIRNASMNVRESERIVDGARDEARQITEQAEKESERLLEQSKAEAARIIEQAKRQQEAMIAESEILKLSKAQCEEIRNAAEREALSTRRSADKYAFDIMNHVENVLGKTMASVERSKQEFDHSEATIAQREKVRP